MKKEIEEEKNKKSNKKKRITRERETQETLQNLGKQQKPGLHCCPSGPLAL